MSASPSSLSAKPKHTTSLRKPPARASEPGENKRTKALNRVQRERVLEFARREGIDIERLAMRTNTGPARVRRVLAEELWFAHQFPARIKLLLLPKLAAITEEVIAETRRQCQEELEVA